MKRALPGEVAQGVGSCPVDVAGRAAAVAVLAPAPLGRGHDARPHPVGDDRPQCDRAAPVLNDDQVAVGDAARRRVGRVNLHRRRPFAAQLAPAIAGLDAAIHEVKQTREGDRLRLEFTADGDTRIVFNGTLLQTVTGGGLAAAMPQIWLGRKPAQESVKKGMLGG